MAIRKPRARKKPATRKKTITNGEYIDLMIKHGRKRYNEWAAFHKKYPSGYAGRSELNRRKAYLEHWQEMSARVKKLGRTKHPATDDFGPNIKIPK